MSERERIAAWIDAASKDDLASLVRFLDTVSLEATVLILQYTADPAGTVVRYARQGA